MFGIRSLSRIAIRDLRCKLYLRLMRKHNGMRPQDLVILTELLVNPESSSQKKELANRLYISQSEVSESMNRSVLSGLVSDKGKVYRQSFFEFIRYGFKYIFPVKPGGMVHGWATAHSHAFMKKVFESEVNYVWADFQGPDHGLSIEPLYAKQTKAVKDNLNLYKALALMDVVRVGRTREIPVALEELEKMFNYGKS